MINAKAHMNSSRFKSLFFYLSLETRSEKFLVLPEQNKPSASIPSFVSDSYCEKHPTEVLCILVTVLNLECLSLRVIRIERRDSLASSMNNSEERDVIFLSSYTLEKLLYD